MQKEWPKSSFKLPTRIFNLRDSSFAADLFFAAVGHLDIFNRLADSPMNIEAICRSLQIKSRPADVMLTLFKSYGFIKERRQVYTITDLARGFLTRDAHFDLTEYINSLKDRPICLDMLQVLRSGKPANWAAAKQGQAWAAAMEDPAFANAFTAGQNSRGAYLAQGLTQAVDFAPYARMLDIGGSSGIYSASICQKYPDLRATVFEKPPVDKAAGYAIKQFGLGGRINVVAGDMFSDDLPAGYDLHFISHVLHDWDWPEVRKILMNSYRSLPPGGTLMVHDAHINQNKSGPVSVAEYSVLLMALSEGKCYSFGEMQELLIECGFHAIEHKPAVLNRSVIIAQK
jgi:SAM-dependent methyltransferase